MKKILIATLIVLSVTLLAVFLVVPAFANDGDNGDAWRDMHEACQSGNWQAMSEAMEQVGDDMPCYGQQSPGSVPGLSNGSGQWGGMMGGGMMGTGGHMGGMMGSR